MASGVGSLGGRFIRGFGWLNVGCVFFSWGLRGLESIVKYCNSVLCFAGLYETRRNIITSDIYRLLLSLI